MCAVGGRLAMVVVCLFVLIGSQIPGVRRRCDLRLRRGGGGRAGGQGSDVSDGSGSRAGSRVSHGSDAAGWSVYVCSFYIACVGCTCRVLWCALSVAVSAQGGGAEKVTHPVLVVLWLSI